MKRVVFAALICASASLAQLPNGEPGGAIPIFEGINPSAPSGVSGTTFTNAGEPEALSAGLPSICGSGPNSDVFYSFTALANGLHTFHTCTPSGFAPGTHIDTILQVLNDTLTTSLGCDDDGCASPNFNSSLTLSLNAGQMVFVRIATWSGEADGSYYLTVVAPTPPPPNGTLATATPVVVGVNPNGPYGVDGSRFTNAGEPEALDTNGGTIPAFGCGSGANSDVFFSWLATCSGDVAVTVCPPPGTSIHGTHLDTILQVLDGTGTTELACDDDTCAPGFGGSAFLSEATFTATEGSTYYIRVASWSGASDGSFYLSVLPKADIQSIGSSCGAVPPVLAGNGPPVLGGFGTVTVDGEANAPGILILSNPTNFYLPLIGGCTIYVDIPSAVVLDVFTTDALGHYEFTAFFPYDVALACVDVNLQAVVGAAGLAFSNGLYLKLWY
jgi:hypothetical protein